MFEEKKNDIALLILRLGGGGFMLAHGVPKLMKFFADVPIKFADPLGIGMMASLVLAVFSEFFCAIALMAGFKTRFCSLTLAITMFVAAFVVHLADPFGRKEKAIMYLVIYIALIFSGGGAFSVDRLMKKA
ncbi:MAG: DoxX family protein [Halobacteriovorax sp.]|nr:DoxX family protein [Halobacteriovorax sp.]|tara:strand:- start:233228 stop:233620 length:393 start_codon:yes stop_codon:yes gene_type:complete